MKSSWDQTRPRSSYHFDPTVQDSAESVMTVLGTLPQNTWQADINSVVAAARPATWADRGYKGQGVPVPSADLASEEYDLERVGVDPKIIITHLNWALPPSLQAIVDQAGLANAMSRIHVQHPGQLWNLHLDKLEKWMPEDPSQVRRIFIQLTDWQPGQFWEFGNYHWNQWRAGDVVTFDWQNMPHATANAGHHVRVTLQITGIVTDAYQDFLSSLADTKYQHVDTALSS